MSEQTPTSLAESEQRDAFVARIFNAFLAAADLLSVYIGDELGLYRSLAEEGPASPSLLAARTRISPSRSRSRRTARSAGMPSKTRSRMAGSTASCPEGDSSATPALLTSAKRSRAGGGVTATWVEPAARCTEASRAE